MKFNYEGFKQGGSVERGSIDAMTKESAIEQLRTKGIYLQQIVPDTEIMREVLSNPTNPEEPAFLNTAKDVGSAVQGSASGVSAFVDDLFVPPAKGIDVGGKVPRQDITVLPAKQDVRQMNTQSKRQSNSPWVKALESDLEDVAVVVGEMANILPLSSKDIMTQIGDKLLYDVACGALNRLKKSKVPGLSHFCSEEKQRFTPEQEKEIRNSLNRMNEKETKKKRAKRGPNPVGDPMGPSDVMPIIPGPNDPIDPNAPVHKPI